MTNPKILVVDDEPFNVDYLEQELEASDYQITAACNGQEALRKIQSEPPDLVLLDIMMPVMDGFQVLSHLKADPARRDIPIIVISANSDMPSVVKGIELGAEDYLPKPFEPTLLHARITASLEKKRLRDLERIYLQGLVRELDIARDIQKGFLPDRLPCLTDWELAAYFKAAREVAGDFYDAFLLPDNNLVFLVGDVCGKGVGAALFMTLFRSLIRAACTMDVFYRDQDKETVRLESRLAKAMTFTNSYIQENHSDSCMYATVFVGALDLQNGTLAYINCGNEPALVLRNGCVVTSLKPTGPVVGIISDAKFHVQEFVLEKDDLILAFTDGIPDARDLNGESFGRSGLLNALEGQQADVASVLQQIEERLHVFIGNAEQFDDIALLAVRKSA
jgi:serine phosphatase RsbU (regulator of sigma subunit)